MTTDAKFTLIFYRPNGSHYLGGGDYDQYNSEIGFDQELTMEKLKHRIATETRHHRFEDECDCEFAILKDGKPILARGEAMWSFEPEGTPCPEAVELGEFLSEERVRSEKEKQEQKRLAEEKAEAERRA